MRRREILPAEDHNSDVLHDFDAFATAVGAPVSGPVSEYSDPRAAVAERYQAWQRWCAARAARAAEHGGWPGGDRARELQERTAHPGAPFNPADL